MLLNLECNWRTHESTDAPDTANKDSDFQKGGEGLL